MWKSLIIAAVVALIALPSAMVVVSPAQVKRGLEKLPAETPSAGLGYEIVRSGNRPVAPRAGYQEIVMCPSGKKVVGGGVGTSNSGQSTTSSGWHKLAASYPAGDRGAGWVASGYNEGTAPGTIEVWAICIVAP